MPDSRPGEQNSCPLSGERGMPCVSRTPGHCDNGVEKMEVMWGKNTTPKAILGRIAEKAFKVSFRERVEALYKGKKYL